jgi:hypothetical protein
MFWLLALSKVNAISAKNTRDKASIIVTEEEDFIFWSLKEWGRMKPMRGPFMASLYICNYHLLLSTKVGLTTRQISRQ